MSFVQISTLFISCIVDPGIIHITVDILLKLYINLSAIRVSFQLHVSYVPISPADVKYVTIVKQ